MASFLLSSNYGDSAFLAQRLKREGHKVKTFIRHPRFKKVYDGLIEKVNSDRPDKGDVVIVDSEGQGKYADALRKQGIPVIGGGMWSDMIELHRDAGVGLMASVGIRTPETKAFTNVSEGIKFLATKQGKWFYKPSGNAEAASTYGGDVDILTRYMRKFPTPEFILQKKVEGTELSFEGWWDGKRFVYPFNSTVEDKRFLAHDIGPNVGCMGNVVWTYDSNYPRLFGITLDRIAPALRRVGYVGPIDINTVIDPNGDVYGLEWTPRFGYDSIQALSLLAPANFGEQLCEFAYGRLPRFDLRGEYAFVVNVSVPPFPHNPNATAISGSPIDRHLLDHPSRVLLRDVMLDAQGLPVMAGALGVVADIGHVGKSFESLRPEVMNFVKSFKIPKAQYRHDCCERTYDVIRELERLHFDLPWMEPVREVPIPVEIVDPVGVPKYPTVADKINILDEYRPSVIVAIQDVPPDSGMSPKFE